MNINQSSEILEYKNLWLFYANLYERLFRLLNSIIEEKKYNITLVKEEVLDFTDNYSYYIIGKKILSEDDVKKTKESDTEVLYSLENFDQFTQKLNKFPSQDFLKIRKDLVHYEYDVTKLGKEKFAHLVKEYYSFFDNVLDVMKNFIDIASENGFLPNIKSKSALKTIGYANYDYFFKELEGLKMKMSEITTHINLNNIMKCRRCIYCILIVFSPYFKRDKIALDLAKRLDFNFLEDEDKIDTLRKSYEYTEIILMPSNLQNTVNSILNPLRKDISLIKRYMSHEFGEIDMSPRIKKKFGFDPTWT